MTIKRRSWIAMALSLTLAFAGADAMSERLAYPPTKTVSVSDTYFGTVVSDPYRWLENGNDPAVKTWAAAQTKLALGYLEATPAYPGLKARIAELERTPPIRYNLAIRGGHLFYERETPPQAQAELIVLDHLGGAERVLFNPATAAVNGVQPAIETIAVSADGAKVAFTTQFGGSEEETIHVIDATDGKMLPDTVAHAGGGQSPVAITWDGDGKGFLHTQWPRNPDGSYATAGIRIFHHVLGTDPATDTYVFGNGLSPKSEYHLATSADGSVQAAAVSDGDGVHASIYLRRNSKPFTLVAGPDAGIGDSDQLGGAFVGNEFYAIATKRNSRGEVVALLPGGTFDTAKVIVPASSVVIDGIVPVGDGFITVDVDGGDSGARLFGADGTQQQVVPVPKISTARIAADPHGGPIIVRYHNYTTNDTWLEYDAKSNTVRNAGFSATPTGDFSKILVDRVFVSSLDGKERIPLEIVHAADIKRDGSAPTVLYAYGGYGIITSPFYEPSLLAWLERGGVFAVAMVRGGGEYGEAWHQAARLATKTVSSDDLAACAMWLGHNGYGNNSHLGILGGSAGGFLMGLALTRNPDLYGAVMAEVGIFDLLRVELTPNGAYNTPEFGTVKDSAQFPWMLKQSPYHNVHAGTAYPAVLMTTGENDPRVEPYNSRKMIARLQADAATVNPILLVQRAGQGHGIGNSFDQSVEDLTERYAFFDSQLR
jgi:prolyl oligopeptidase